MKNINKIQIWKYKYNINNMTKDMKLKWNPIFIIKSWDYILIFKFDPIFIARSIKRFLTFVRVDMGRCGGI